jgi:hypothetical protein
MRYEKLYSLEHLTYKIHSLRHFAIQVLIFWRLHKHAAFHFEGTILLFQLFLLLFLIARRPCNEWTPASILISKKFEKVKFILRSPPVCRREIFLEIQAFIESNEAFKSSLIL